jgi:hypothetical protein
MLQLKALIIDSSSSGRSSTTVSRTRACSLGRAIPALRDHWVLGILLYIERSAGLLSLLGLLPLRILLGLLPHFSDVVQYLLHIERSAGLLSLVGWPA